MRTPTILLVAAGLLAAGCGPSSNPTTPTADPPAAVSSDPSPAPATSSTDPPPTSTTTAGPVGDLPVIELSDRLQASLDSWAQRADIPGVIASVNVADTGFHWSGAAGVTATDDGQPLSADHPFRIASITKTITAATVLTLADSRKLDIETTIDAYLPPTITDEVHVADGVSQGREITVRQLLAHTSGVHDYFSDPAFVPDVLADPGRVWTPEELVDYAVTHGEPHFSPGEGYHYSDTGYVLLGLVVEHITGQPLHDVYRALIFDPLGMDDTYLEGLEPSRGLPLSHPYVGEIDGLTVHHSFDWAGGGLVSTAADLNRFITALTEGRLLEAATLGDMSSLQVTETRPGYELLYGLGYLGFRSGSFQMVGHDGDWGSFMYSVPETGTTVTGTINQADASQLDLVFELLEALPE